MIKRTDPFCCHSNFKTDNNKEFYRSILIIEWEKEVEAFCQSMENRNMQWTVFCFTMVLDSKTQMNTIYLTMSWRWKILEPFHREVTFFSSLFADFSNN